MMGLSTPSAPPPTAVAWTDAVQEILGADIAQAFLTAPPAPWRNVLPALCTRYGLRGGLGIGVRLGRAFARHMFPVLAVDEGLQAPDVRLLPWPRRMAVGVTRLADWAVREFQIAVQVRPQDEGFLWLAPCPFGEVTAPEGIVACSPWVGLLEETLYWLSGGRWFAIAPYTHKDALFLPRHPLH